MMGTRRADAWLESFAFHDEPGVYRAEFDTATTDASVAVIGALSEVLGTDPTTIEPLYESIETDALDDIVDPHAATGDVEVAFAIEGRDVTVDSDGTIEIEAQLGDLGDDSTDGGPIE